MARTVCTWLLVIGLVPVGACGAGEPRADATRSAAGSSGEGASATPSPAATTTGAGSRTAAASATPRLVRVGSGDREGVLFAGDRARELLAAHGLSADATWDPDPATLATLEDALPAWIGTAAGSTSGPRIVSRWSSYRRQYAGFVRGGRRAIFASYFCGRADEPGWRSEPISVDDGGDCYFLVSYDPVTRTFFDLSVNGEA